MTSTPAGTGSFRHGPKSFHDWLLHVAAQPEFSASALTDTSRQCRYRELPACVSSIQTYLASLGVAEGACIAADISNSVPGALLLLALLDAGHGVVVSPMRSGPSSEPSVPGFCAWRLSVRTDAAARHADLHQPAAYLRAQRNEVSSPAHRAYPGLEDLLLLRSSGSLSTPKLVAHRSERLLGNALNVHERLQLNAHHRVVLPVPIFHMYGLGAGFLPALCGGATVCLLEGANALTFFEAERSFQPDVAFLTPTFCDLLLQLRRAPRRYDFIVSAGDTIPARVFGRMEELHGPLLNLYGSTEMGSISVASPQLPRETRGGTVGVPYAGVTCRIVENAFDGEIESGFGELQVKHEYGFQGYVDPEGGFLDAPAAFDDGWFRTGDYATARADGTIQIFGRRDLSVKRDGRLLPLADVEQRLREIAGIRQAAVAVSGESVRGRRLIAFCVTDSGAPLSEPEIRRRCTGCVPSYAVPDEFQIVETLPMLPNGKVDRRALAALAQRTELRA